MADKQDTYNKIVTIIAEKLHVETATILPDVTLQDLGADSLDMVEIILKIEEEFSIAINDEDAEKLHTLQEVVDYVHAKRSL